VNLNVPEILHACRLFARVETRGFQRLVAIARMCEFDKAELIFRENQECPGIYVVGSGLVRVFKTGANGKEHVLHMIGPGNTFAEVAAIGGFRCPAHAEAVSPTTTALLPYGSFRQLLETDPQLCREMMVGMAVWVRNLVDLIEDVVLRDAAGRLARYLLETEADASDVVELPTLKRYVASHLNLTSETFSRTIRRLADAGLIAEPDPYHVRLLDRNRLRQVADGLVSDV
jgi:CRP/FNR family transcriptional regulator, dissimilatory nitrate respiration regulator